MQNEEVVNAKTMRNNQVLTSTKVDIFVKRLKKKTKKTASSKKIMPTLSVQLEVRIVV